MGAGGYVSGMVTGEGSIAWTSPVATHATEAEEDLALVARVQKGEVAAFDVIFRKYRERVFSIVYHLTSNREDAADLTQEAFIRALQSIQKFHGTSSFFTWLYRIAVNGTYTHLRKRRFKQFFSFETLQGGEAPPDLLQALQVEGTQGNALVLNELQQRLNEAFQKLSLDHRTVVTLFEIEGLSHLEIADITGCSIGTVRSRLHYAKLQLQSELQDLLPR
jgi:RNA polymerase sigma-70 factor, ECF subfamily